jgi:hypothetical protein
METGRLILHVGFPKTGTTTLQRWLAKHCQGRYLGKAAPGLDLPDFDLFPALRAAVTRPTIWATERWSTAEIAPVAKAIPKAIEAVGSPIVSDEDLVRVIQRRGRGFPFLENKEPPLVSLLAVLAQDFEIDVLVTLRAQSTWLPSTYAELARQMVSPSQQDFECRLNEFLIDPTPTGSSYCDWAAWIVQLRGAVGLEHLHCLLLEDMATAEYWQTAAALFGVPASNPPKRVVNALAVKEDEWALRELIPRAVNHLGESSPRGTIVMPSHLREAVRATYRDSNARLAGLLDRSFDELSSLGY